MRVSPTPTQFNIALGKLGEARLAGLPRTVGTEFIPILTEIIEGVTEIWQEIDGPVLHRAPAYSPGYPRRCTLRNAFEIIIAGAIDVVAGMC